MTAAPPGRLAIPSCLQYTMDLCSLRIRLWDSLPLFCFEDYIGHEWYRRRRKSIRFRPIRHLQNATQPISLTARGLIMDAIRTTLAKAGVPASVSMIYPEEYVIASMGYGAAQLSVA